MQESYYKAAAECLKVLANPHRIKIIAILRGGAKTVGEIAEALGLLSHVTSEHLRLMQHCGFLSSRREGRFIHYQIHEEHLFELLACIERRFSLENKDEKHTGHRVQKTSRAKRSKKAR
jgi:DNA-binding transcriptional ArsR family regulator